MVRRALLAASLVLLLGAADAHACSCVQGDPEASLRQSDGALTGAVVKNRARRGYYVLRVRRAFKGDLDGRVRVYDSAPFTSCALGLRRGQRVALFLVRSGGRWQANSCDQTTGRDLREASRGARGAGSEPGGGSPCSR